MSDAVIYERSQYPSRREWLFSLAVLLLVPAIDIVLDGGRWEITALDLIFETVLLVVRLLLVKLTVTLFFTELRLAYSLGWPRKRIKRSDIRSVTPVRDWSRDARAVRSNYLLWIQGRQGVLLGLADGKSLFVGADDPDALVAALNL